VTNSANQETDRRFYFTVAPMIINLSVFFTAKHAWKVSNLQCTTVLK